jgi:hypothetical protein
VVNNVYIYFGDERSRAVWAVSLFNGHALYLIHTTFRELTVFSFR